MNKRDEQVYLRDGVLPRRLGKTDLSLLSLFRRHSRSCDQQAVHLLCNSIQWWRAVDAGQQGRLHDKKRRCEQTITF